MRRFSIVSLIVFLVACWLPVIGNAGQDITRELLEIENAFEETISRAEDQALPLGWAAGFLGRKMGVPVSYEDPAWAWSGDFSPFAEHPGNAQRVQDNPDVDFGLIPRGGHIEMRLDMNRITQEVRGSPQTILERALEDHRARGNPGQFRVLELEGGEFVITPTGAMDSEGKMLAQGSPFDTRISLRAETRNGVAAVEAICAAITAAGGAPGGLLLYPDEWLSQQEVLIGADNEPAREVLARVFREANWINPAVHPRPPAKLSWRLMHDAKSNTFVLNIYILQREVPVPASNVPKLEIVYRR